MGRIYRAHDTKLNEEVAIKLLRPEITAQKRTVERFRGEPKTARKISRAYIAPTVIPGPRSSPPGDGLSQIDLRQEFGQGQHPRLRRRFPPLEVINNLDRLGPF